MQLRIHVAAVLLFIAVAPDCCGQELEPRNLKIGQVGNFGQYPFYVDEIRSKTEMVVRGARSADPKLMVVVQGWNTDGLVDDKLLAFGQQTFKVVRTVKLRGRTMFLIETVGKVKD